MSGPKSKDYHQPGYWTDFRQQCIKKKRCYKCPRKLFKWGLCRYHVKKNVESRDRRRRKLAAAARRSGELRIHRCHHCKKIGHNIRTCPKPRRQKSVRNQ